MIDPALLLNAALDTGLELLAEAGFPDEAGSIRTRLANEPVKQRKAAFERVFEDAEKAIAPCDITPLMKEGRFREAIISGLLDPELGFDLKSFSDSYGKELPLSPRALRKFFSFLEDGLMEDPTWGPVLEPFQELRFQKDVLEALGAEELDVPPAEIVAGLNAALDKSGAIAHGQNAVAIGKRGVHIAGDVIGGFVITGDENVINIHNGSSPEDLRHRYLADLSAATGHLPWATVDPEYADPKGGENIGLADIYTSLDTTEMEKAESEDEVRTHLARQDQARRISAQETINNHFRVVLLGDPGSGKSTVVNFLTYVLAMAGQDATPDQWLGRLKESGPWDHGALLPVRIILRELAANFEVEESRKNSAGLFLENYILTLFEQLRLTDIWEILHNQLLSRDTPLLILLDGLDEVPVSIRPHIIAVLNSFINKYPHNRYIVTCRIYAYVGKENRLQGFHQATLTPFDKEQVEAFISTWYRELSRRGRLTETDANKRAAQLKAVATGPDLFGLAERPLLLTVMALLHTFRGQLPEDRVELYQSSVELLLKRWEGRFGGEKGIIQTLHIPGLKMNNLEAGLYDVAFFAHAAGNHNDGIADIGEGTLRERLAPYLDNDWNKAGEFVKYVRERAGLLIRHKPDAYTFPHRTFQEFMAACHLTGMEEYPKEAADLIAKDRERWRIVFILAAGHAARTHRPGQALAAINALCPSGVRDVDTPDAAAFLRTVIAGEALLEIGLLTVRGDNVGKAVLERVKKWLISALSADHLLEAEERAEAGNILSQLVDPRFLPDFFFLPDEPLLGFIEISSGPFTMGSDKGVDPAAEDYEMPRHKLSLSKYYIARYPVTVSQFRIFIEKSGYSTYYENSLAGHNNHPVRYATWYDAMEYCKWLTETLRNDKRTPEPLASLVREKGWRVRLPSEAQWEKAARGTDNRIYPWGDKPDSNLANYDDTNIDGTSPAGSFKGGASPYGCMDMSGNIWEWTRSLWGKEFGKPDFNYPYIPDDKREDEEADGETLRVLRGGSFDNVCSSVRCSARVGASPDDWYWLDGFRVVVSPSFL